MQINHCELSDFGAKLLAEYEISGSEIENSYFKGRNRSGFVHYMNTIGLKTLKLPMVFCGRSAHEIAAAKTRLDAAFLGKMNCIWTTDSAIRLCWMMQAN